MPRHSSGVAAVGFYLGGQDFIHAQSHFDLVLASAGGANRVSGDYLFRDQAGPGNMGGLWGVLRVGNVPAAACGPYRRPAAQPEGAADLGRALLGSREAR